MSNINKEELRHRKYADVKKEKYLKEVVNLIETNFENKGITNFNQKSKNNLVLPRSTKYRWSIHM